MGAAAGAGGGSGRVWEEARLAQHVALVSGGLEQPRYEDIIRTERRVPSVCVDGRCEVQRIEAGMH